MPRNRTIRLRGEDCRLIFRNKVINYDGNNMPYECDGLCDPPKTRRRAIRINRNLDSRGMLYTLLHEMIHFCQWDLDEDVVEEISDDMANALDALGFRKVD